MEAAASTSNNNIGGEAGVEDNDSGVCGDKKKDEEGEEEAEGLKKRPIEPQQQRKKTRKKAKVGWTFENLGSLVVPQRKASVKAESSLVLKEHIEVPEPHLKRKRLCAALNAANLLNR